MHVRVPGAELDQGEHQGREIGAHWEREGEKEHPTSTSVA